MKQSGSLARVVLVAAMILGASYLYVVIAQVTGPFAVLWKGSGVGLLALYAALQARGTDGWLLTLVMAFGALGDVLLDTSGMVAGAAAFVIGHFLAIALYVRNRRDRTTLSQKWLATLLLPLGVLIAVWSVPISERPTIGIYTAIVATMAGAAWMSRFPRYRTGIGAVMFLVSDLLIFARLGPLAGMIWVGPVLWALYFGGQLLITLGVTGRLVTDQIDGSR